MAKISIISVKSNNDIVNLLTTIKVTDFDEKKEKLKQIDKFNINNNKTIYVYEGYLCEDELILFQEQIANSAVTINKTKIKYNVNKNPRSSFLMQIEDHNRDKYNQITSPFYSNCYLEENWNIDVNIKNLWLEIDEKNREKIKKYLDINLDYFIDKTGNVLKFIQVNEVDVDIEHQNEKFITLGFKINKPLNDDKYANNKYVANIEIKSASDIILKKSFEISEKHVDIALQDVDDNIQIEIYNLTNSRCVYKNNFRYLGIGTTTIHCIEKDITTIPPTQKIVKEKEKIEFESASLENLRKKWTRKIKRKDESEFIRFDNTQNDKAIEHIIKTLTNIASFNGLENTSPEFVYLADPYIFDALNNDTYKTLLNVASKFPKTNLRIIGCQNSIPEFLRNEIQNNPQVYSNVQVKSVRRKTKDKSGNYESFIQPDGTVEFKTKETFHDRFLATKHLEYGFTNSLNNFKKALLFLDLLIFILKMLKHCGIPLQLRIL